MLDLQKTGLPQIIDAMVKKLLEKKEVSSQTSLEEARHAIFTQDSGERDLVRWGGRPERPRGILPTGQKIRLYEYKF